MRNFVLSALSCLFCAVSVIAQVTFQKSYSSTKSIYGTWLQEAPDGSLFVIGGRTDGIKYPVFVRSDSTGNLLAANYFNGMNCDPGKGVLTNNGLVFTGNSGAGAYSTMYILKSDLNGNLAWMRNYSVYGSDFTGNSIEKNTDNGFILCGDNKRYGSKDFFLVRTNDIGDTLWTRTIGSSDDETAFYARQTHDKGFVVVGNSVHSITDKILAIKTDSNGILLWSQLYGPGTASFVAETQNHGLLIVSNRNPSVNEVTIIRTDSAGIKLWANTYQGAAGVYANGFDLTTDDGCVFCGKNGIYKIDQNGGVAWAKSIIHDNETIDLSSIIQLQNGGFALTGSSIRSSSTDKNILILKLDQSGNSECDSVNYNVTTSLFSSTFINLAVSVYRGSNIASHSLTTVTLNLSDTSYCISGPGPGTGMPVSPLAENSSFHLFPNPSTGLVSFRNNDTDVVKRISIYNVLGEKVIDRVSSSGPIENQVELNSGIYFVIFYAGNKLFSEKLIITP